MRFAWLVFGIGVLSLAVGQSAKPPKTSAVQSAATKVNRVSYANDIAPIFKAHCLSCHGGPTGNAGLDLTDGKFAASKKLVVPGKPAQSEFLRRVKGLGGKSQMPNGFKPLEAAKIAKIQTWILEGAAIDSKVEKHWAYIAPVRPKVPVIPSKWISNPIDAFALEQMTKRGLNPAVKASKESLIRRLKLDLVGLPPTIEEIDAFIADSRPNAYEALVDSFLGNAGYGERQARMWLDLARYADTNGYEADRNRSAWLFRDWVINAFNSNMPFSTFTIDQLAGDMVPNATIDQKVASGFHRNSMMNEEGGIDPDEARYTMLVDRVATTSMVWMGSTLQCARCHDHKFDPFSQKDFFKMYAIFGNTDFEVRGRRIDGQERYYEPSMPVPTAEIREQLREIEKKTAAAAQQLAEESNNQADAISARVALIGTPVAWTPAEAQTASAVGATLLISEKNFVNATGKNLPKERYTLTGPWISGSSAIRLQAELGANQGVGRSDGKNFLLTSIRLKVDGKNVPFSCGSADFVQASYSIDELLTGNLESGWAIFPKNSEPHSLALELLAPIAGSTFELTLAFESQWEQHNLSAFRLSFTPDSFASRTHAPANSAALRDFASKGIPTLIERHTAIRALKSESSRIGQMLPVALVLTEKPAKSPLTAPVYHRGEFVSPGPPVPAGVPTVMSPFTAPVFNRLSFANWLVTPSQPLTARVQVNRMWSQYFGYGLVNSVDDFGTQGTKPTHPKLLDWLATEFVRVGWDMKAMHKLIVTSSTYQQSSKLTTEAYRNDPTNRWLARGARFRMEAEMIRDTALTASKLLFSKIGGPSVMPYQPNGIWDSPYSGEQWMEARNTDRYRRGIYVFWKRSSTYPSFVAFDASSREICTTDRVKTNTPLQALTLLNDIAFLEAAGALGKGMRAQPSDAKGIEYGFRSATGRRPGPSESGSLAQTLNKFREHYKRQPDLAEKIAENAEAASWTMIGNVLLNLDETITKE